LALSDCADGFKFRLNAKRQLLSTRYYPRVNAAITTITKTTNIAAPVPSNNISLNKSGFIKSSLRMMNSFFGFLDAAGLDGETRLPAI